MSRIDNVECHSMNLSERANRSISGTLRWHRFKGGVQLPQGYTATETFSTETLGPQGDAILRGVWGQVKPRATSIVEWHEGNVWPELDISGIDVDCVRVEWHRPPRPGLGINIQYDRLDATTGEAIPRWRGDLLLEYSWVRDGVRYMTINMKPDHLVPEAQAQLIVAEAKQMLLFAEGIIRRWEGLG